MTPQIIERLKAEVHDLQRRVEGAGSLAALMQKEAVPRVTPCAHVIPTSITAPTRPPAISGGYVQAIDRGFAVILSLRIHDPNGARALDEAASLIEAIIMALAGWEPSEDCIGIFEFRRAVLVAFDRGVAVYEIDFALPDQLRT